jgi:hypothetical protein
MDSASPSRSPRAIDARAPAPSTNAAFSCLAALATLASCQPESVSVGELRCSDDTRVLCESHPQQRWDPVLVQIGPDTETTAEIVWQHELAWFSPTCSGMSCFTSWTDFLVHEDGEVTLAGASGEARDELWISRLDAEGTPLFTTMLPVEGDWLQSGLLTDLALRRDANGDALLLAGSGDDGSGTLRAFSIARSGHIEASFELDTGKQWPHVPALLDSDVVLVGSSVDLARYSRAGELKWQQTQLARRPGGRELGFEVDGDAPLRVLQLAVDGRQRIWAALEEGAFGIVQLDPDGFVAAHGVLPLLTTSTSGGCATSIAIDSRDRAIVGFGEAVVRFDPDGSDEQRRAPLGSSGLQDGFYPQTVDGLDVDAQDLMYVATQDGLRSQRRLLIERVSEDFRQRDRFVIPLAPIDTIGRVVCGLQLAGDGDAYVRIVPDGNVPDQTDVRIARVRLGKNPDASSHPSR